MIEWKLEGMTCSNCANGVAKFLEKKGMKEVFVNFSTGILQFVPPSAQFPLQELITGIEKLGYKVLDPAGKPASRFGLTQKLILSLVFTGPLLIGHFLMLLGIHIPFTHAIGWQLFWSTPAILVGLFHFGPSAWSSVKTRVPNMDVLIFLGGFTALVYSILGVCIAKPEMLFFETSASIFTLVLLGNWLEKRAVGQTTTAIEELNKLQTDTARVVTPSGAVVSLSISELQPGHILVVNEGDSVPADGIISGGEAWMDESLVTGESEPVYRSIGDRVIGASIVVSGNLTVQVRALGKESVLGQMIELVKNAQREKPPIQRLADKISAIFVPIVLSIALCTFLFGWIVFDLSLQQALLNAIAVVVISCPCAMGLATPTAIMVGVGRLAKAGILVKGGATLELMSKIEKVVFDKTGTLTTGDFSLEHIEYLKQDKHWIDSIIGSMEQHSSHPLAKSIQKLFPVGQPMKFEKVQEIKGAGIEAWDYEGNHFRLGSPSAFLPQQPSPGAGFVLLKNGELVAKANFTDTLRPGAAEAIQKLSKEGIRSFILSGDNESNTKAVAQSLGIDHYYAQKTPSEKLHLIETMARQGQVAMVGDGINDAAALAKATLGISFGQASKIAIQSAQVILLGGHLEQLIKAIAYSKATLKTVRQNLFWAFAYNIVAIPVAAMGFLDPMWAAAFMAFSDVVVIGNSLRLRFKNVKY